jgi:hypothetical protein
MLRMQDPPVFDTPVRESEIERFNIDPKARVSYIGSWCDGVDRQIASSSYGAIASYTGRGRDRPFGRPPAQIRTCRITAYGSYFGCLA